jgi:hypothetical protein
LFIYFIHCTCNSFNLIKEIHEGTRISYESFATKHCLYTYPFFHFMLRMGISVHILVNTCTVFINVKKKLFCRTKRVDLKNNLTKILHYLFFTNFTFSLDIIERGETGRMIRCQCFRFTNDSEQTKILRLFPYTFFFFLSIPFLVFYIFLF